MKINPWFYAVQALVNEEGHLNGLSVEQLSSKGRAYYKIDLERQHNIPGTDYTITHHHIRISPKYDDDNPHMTCYHYSAHLRDSHDQSFRLHVYFNRQDHLTTAPELQDKHQQSVNLNDELLHAFAEQAVQAGHHTIAFLREQHRNMLSDLLKTHAAQNQQLENLSVDFQSNKADYFSILKDHIKSLQPLTKLADQQAYFKGKLSLCQKFYKQLQQDLAPEEAAAQWIMATEDSDSSDEEIDYSIQAGSSSNAPRAPLPVPEENLLNLILTARDNYEQEQNAETIAAYFQAINNIFLLGKTTELTLEERAQLQGHVSTCEKIGSDQLVRALLTGDFESARKLFYFTNFIAHNTFVMSMTANRPQIADFLLSHSELSHQSTLFKPGRDGESTLPVCYCLRRCREKDYNDLLAVLIGHGASVLVPYDDGLPVAFHILKDPQHPLRKALTHSDRAKAPRFYKQLITLLNEYVASQDLTERVRAEIQNMITLFEVILHDRQQGKNISGRLQPDELDQLLNRLDTGILESLYADPQILEAYGQLQQQVKRYNRQLNGLERNDAHQQRLLDKQQSSQQKRDLMAIVNEIKGMKLTINKEEILRVIKIDSTIIDKKIEAIAISIRLKKEKRPKQFAALHAKQEALGREIDELLILRTTDQRSQAVARRQSASLLLDGLDQLDKLAKNLETLFNHVERFKQLQERRALELAEPPAEDVHPQTIDEGPALKNLTLYYQTLRVSRR